MKYLKKADALLVIDDVIPRTIKMEREGWQEIIFENKLNSGIRESAKVCDGCKHLKRYEVSMEYPGGSFPTGVFMDRCEKLNKSFSKNIHGNINAPGLDGEKCPFHKQVERNIKIERVLK